MGVADVFSTKSAGTIAKGLIKRGRIKAGDEVELIGIKDTKKTTVMGVETFGKVLSQGQAGDIVTCLLNNIDIKDINRDHVLAQPGSITAHTKFTAEVDILKKEEGGRHTPIFTGFRPQFFIATADVTGVVTLLPEGKAMVMPGDRITMNIELIAPIYMEEYMRFAIRDGSSTIAVGIVTKILT
jgi:elongation factor Tu